MRAGSLWHKTASNSSEQSSTSRWTSLPASCRLDRAGLAGREGGSARCLHHDDTRDQGLHIIWRVLGVSKLSRYQPLPYQDSLAEEISHKTQRVVALLKVVGQYHQFHKVPPRSCLGSPLEPALHCIVV